MPRKKIIKEKPKKNFKANKQFGFCENPSYYYDGKYGKVFVREEEKCFIHNGIYYERPYLFNAGYIKHPVTAVPCRICPACRGRYGAEWSIRCWFESIQYDNNQFITLTYDDNHEPKKGVNKKELSKFIHTLREHFRRKQNHIGIRFYACGEYGEQFLRPHYHILLFNCPPFGDEKHYKTNGIGQKIFTSKILSHLWHKGLCTIGKVTKKSIEYVTGYLSKTDYTNLPKELNKPFNNMSRRSGLGINHFFENVSYILENDGILVSGGKKVRLPEYYNKLIKKFYGKDFYDQEIKGKRLEKAKSFIEKKEKPTQDRNLLTIEFFKKSLHLEEDKNE